jgi:3-methyladenine DNA glycosylase AlkD
VDVDMLKNGRQFGSDYFERQRMYMIRPAKTEDLDTIMNIYSIARKYMVDNGNPTQWPDSYPSQEILENDIQSGQLFVCKENDRIHGVFAFVTGPETTYSHIEGSWKNDDPYGTIHRIASDGTVKGVFGKCLDFCRKRISNIRIDTHSDNHTMRRLIEKNGFERCGIIYVRNGTPRIAYHHTEVEIQRRLFELQDLKYKEFSCKLIPTVNPNTVIGVRTPELRKLAREYAHTPQAEEFLSVLPHKYYEENNLHGFLIETIRDYDFAIQEIEAFLPYIDNWATCDQISPKVFKKHLPELYEKIKIWMRSDRTYTVRFGIGMLLSFYLGDAFRMEMPGLVAGIRSEEYYINMMIAWYFATALAKQPDAVMSFIQEQRLEKWTHNMAIQKAIESYRISDEMKSYLRTLKIK